MFYDTDTRAEKKKICILIMIRRQVASKNTETQSKRRIARACARLNVLPDIE